jgi:hypothetical protein
LISPYLLATLDAGSGENFGKPSFSKFFYNIKDVITQNAFFNQLIRTFPDKFLILISICTVIILIIWYTKINVNYYRSINLIVFPILCFLIFLVAASISGQTISLSRGSWYLFVFLLVSISVLFSDIEVRLRISAYLVNVVIVLICFAAWSTSSMRFAHDYNLSSYLLGKQSLNHYSSIENKYLLNLSEAVICAQKDGKVLALFWDNKIGPAHLIKSGVTTSVSYSMGVDTYAKIAFGNTAEAISSFDKLHLRYLILPQDSTSQLDLGLGDASFTSKFALNKFFSPVSNVDNFLILERKLDSPKPKLLQNKCRNVVVTPKENLNINGWLKYKKEQEFPLHRMLQLKYNRYGINIVEVPLSAANLGKGWQ